MSKNHGVKHYFRVVKFILDKNNKNRMSVVVENASNSQDYIGVLECKDYLREGVVKEGFFRFAENLSGGAQAISRPRDVSYLDRIDLISLKGGPMRRTLRRTPAGWNIEKTVD